MEIHNFFLEHTTVEKWDYVHLISTEDLPLISCSIVCVAFMASGFEQKPFEKVNNCPTRCDYIQFISVNCSTCRDGFTSARCCNYSYMCSRWWVELPPEACRAVYRNIIKCIQSHLVGQILTLIRDARTHDHKIHLKRIYITTEHSSVLSFLYRASFQYIE